MDPFPACVTDRAYTTTDTLAPPPMNNALMVGAQRHSNGCSSRHIYKNPEKKSNNIKVPGHHRMLFCSIPVPRCPGLVNLKEGQKSTNAAYKYHVE